MNSASPLVASALDIAPRARKTNYPEPFAARVNGRSKRALGDHFGLRNFGVNLTTLAPGAWSALCHRHTLQDEFIYLVEGRLLLVTDGEETVLEAGMCAGFRAGGTAHCLVNRFDAPACYIEVGDRTSGDTVTYPHDDLIATSVEGRWFFAHRDGTPYA